MEGNSHVQPSRALDHGLARVNAFDFEASCSEIRNVSPGPAPDVEPPDRAWAKAPHEAEHVLGFGRVILVCVKPVVPLGILTEGCGFHLGFRVSAHWCPRAKVTTASMTRSCCWSDMPMPLGR